MRCLFTFFAEDEGLSKEGAFTDLLRDLREAHRFPGMVRSLWEFRNPGTNFLPIPRARVLRFNGGLFESADALAPAEDQLGLMAEAGERDRGRHDLDEVGGTMASHGATAVVRSTERCDRS